MMKRFPDWQVRLNAYVAASARTKFDDMHCAAFAAGAVQAMTGEDLSKGWPKDLKAGMKALRRKKIKDHVELAARLLDEAHPAFAQVGDVAAVPVEDGTALGIVQGARIYLIGANGLKTVPLLSATRAFRV
jgi:hypothetical protein